MTSSVQEVFPRGGFGRSLPLLLGVAHASMIGSRSTGEERDNCMHYQLTVAPHPGEHKEVIPRWR